MSSRIALALTAAAVALGVAAPAAGASSIVYVKAGNVWLANPDGSGQYQVTFDGTPESSYQSPSQADDGTIVVGKGSQVVRLKQNGEQLSAFTPPSTTDSAGGGIGGSLGTVLGTAVTPDGSKVALYYAQSSCPSGAGCGPRVALIYQYADHQTPISTFGTQHDVRNPNWISNSRTVVFGGYGIQADLHDPNGGNDNFVHWFDDPSTDLGDGELSRSGTRFAAIRGYDATKQLVIYNVSGDASQGAPPAAPTAVCHTGQGYDYAGPTWSPDGSQVAYVTSDGVHVLNVPALDPSDANTCDAITGGLRIPGATQPDWGPADVNPGPRPTGIVIVDPPGKGPDLPPPGPQPAAACVVPKLTKLTLPKAKSALKKAGCALGKVSPRKPKSGWIVTKQGLKAGKKYAAGKQVSVTLAKPKPKHRKKRH